MSVNGCTKVGGGDLAGADRIMNDDWPHDRFAL